MKILFCFWFLIVIKINFVTDKVQGDSNADLRRRPELTPDTCFKTHFWFGLYEFQNLSEKGLSKHAQPIGCNQEAPQLITRITQTSISNFRLMLHESQVFTNWNGGISLTTISILRTRISEMVDQTSFKYVWGRQQVGKFSLI